MTSNEIKDKFNYTFTGHDIFNVIFQNKNLSAGEYIIYVNNGHYLCDNYDFRKALSEFTHSIDSLGKFYISTFNFENRIIIKSNEFDYKISFLNDDDDIFRIVPTYFIDDQFRWCLYFDNDRDIFIGWCKNEFAPAFISAFSSNDYDFYREKSFDALWNTLYERVKYLGLSYQEVKEQMLIPNSYLF
ncbi:hypothetical protein GCM10027036_26670 [Flavihumibacter cheonanensis]|uniref:hypothetical protein n=1 Tax=Flavihumibacter cheonanensis TaxID=1442385 RepID=UPI001EF92461|nr:hypothetical protein [Flavihumibacter cheonanensis]MCG7753310.1 hypothetical protein [Flavihumibacter cheonanensis]